MANIIFTRYIKDTGEIIGTESGVGLAAPIDDVVYGYILGEYAADRFYINSNNELAEFTSEVLSRRSARPAYPARWDNTSLNWIDLRNTLTLVSKALSDIDTLAGETRLKYITSVPGQAETYAKKEQQAREYQASAFNGDVPPFILAEATALNITPQALAEQVIALADFWANAKGPQIEATRRKWKVALESVTSPDEVPILLEEAKAEFATL